MAVSIDTVYQRVLVLANKEQRGYITPQEFNLLANHAQMEIFEQYFYDINQFNRVAGNTQEYSDMLTILYEKVGEFEMVRDNAWMNTNMPVVADIMSIPANEIYRVGEIEVGSQAVEMLNRKDFSAAIRSPLTSPSLHRPIAQITNSGVKIALTGDPTPSFATPANAIAGLHPEISINYVMRPPTVQWAYVVINDKPLYNDNISVNFELHSSEETELVYKILKLAGVNLKAQEVVQVGQTLEQTQQQQEKQ
jgi:hypothetical protein